MQFLCFYLYQLSWTRLEDIILLSADTFPLIYMFCWKEWIIKWYFQSAKVYDIHVMICFQQQILCFVENKNDKERN